MIPRYQVGVWDNADERGSWGFACAWLGDSLPRARKELAKLWRRLPPDTARWAAYILDQRTEEAIYE